MRKEFKMSSVFSYYIYKEHPPQKQKKICAQIISPIIQAQTILFFRSPISTVPRSCT